MVNKNTADIGFEKQIWDAACVLRGNMDASEYKNVVLGLIFLKYISDRFDDKYKELLDEGDGFEEDIDEYTSEGIFFVPAGVSIINYFDELKSTAVQLIIICIISTVVTFAVTAYSVMLTVRLMKKWKDRRKKA